MLPSHNFTFLFLLLFPGESSAAHQGGEDRNESKHVYVCGSGEQNKEREGGG